VTSVTCSAALIIYLSWAARLPPHQLPPGQTVSGLTQCTEAKTPGLKFLSAWERGLLFLQADYGSNDASGGALLTRGKDELVEDAGETAPKAEILPEEEARSGNHRPSWSNGVTLAGGEFCGSFLGTLHHRIGESKV
jgi:hypothetical protein